MQKKLEDFSKEDIMRLAQTPAGQQLIAMLKQTDTARLQQAITQAQTGDLAQASQTLSALLSSPEAQKLMKQLGGN